MSDTPKFLSKNAKLLRKNAKVAQFSGLVQPTKKKKLSSQNVGINAIALVSDILTNYTFPMLPKLSYSGLRKARMERNMVEDGVITINASFRTNSGVQASFDVPVEIRNGDMIEPSVIVYNGVPKIIAQTSFDDISAANTFFQERESREMYSAPYDDVKTSKSKNQRVNTGLFSVSANKRRLQAAIAGKSIKAQLTPATTPQFIMPGLPLDHYDSQTESFIYIGNVKGFPVEVSVPKDINTYTSTVSVYSKHDRSVSIRHNRSSDDQSILASDILTIINVIETSDDVVQFCQIISNTDCDDVLFDIDGQPAEYDTTYPTEAYARFMGLENPASHDTSVAMTESQLIDLFRQKKNKEGKDVDTAVAEAIAEGASGTPNPPEDEVKYLKSIYKLAQQDPSLDVNAIMDHLQSLEAGVLEAKSKMETDPSAKQQYEQAKRNFDSVNALWEKVKKTIISASRKASPEDYDADDKHEKPEPNRNDFGDHDCLDPAETFEEMDIHAGTETSLKEAIEVKDRGGVAYDFDKGTSVKVIRDLAGDNKSFVVEFDSGLQAIVERHFLKGASKTAQSDEFSDAYNNALNEQEAINEQELFDQEHSENTEYWDNISDQAKTFQDELSFGYDKEAQKDITHLNTPHYRKIQKDVWNKDPYETAKDIWNTADQDDDLEMWLYTDRDVQRNLREKRDTSVAPGAEDVARELLDESVPSTFELDDIFTEDLLKEAQHDYGEQEDDSQNLQTHKLVMIDEALDKGKQVQVWNQEEYIDHRTDFLDAFINDNSDKLSAMIQKIITSPKETTRGRQYHFAPDISSFKAIGHDPDSISEIPLLIRLSDNNKIRTDIKGYHGAEYKIPNNKEELEYIVREELAAIYSKLYKDSVAQYNPQDGYYVDIGASRTAQSLKIPKQPKIPKPKLPKMPKQPSTSKAPPKTLQETPKNLTAPKLPTPKPVIQQKKQCQKCLTGSCEYHRKKIKPLPSSI